jgi:hypothetical protein
VSNHVGPAARIFALLPFPTEDLHRVYLPLLPALEGIMRRPTDRAYNEQCGL